MHLTFIFYVFLERGVSMKIKELNRTPKHITSIGGQALIEGVMMRGPKEVAIAVRKPDGDIVLKSDKLNTLGMRYKFFRLPFIRGVVGLVEAMVIGTKALTYSSEFYEEADEVKEGLVDRVFKEKAEGVYIFLAVLTSVLLSVGIFMFIPTLITTLFKDIVGSVVALNLIEGLFRIIIFLIYVIAISKMEDIRRVFEYHGAEHKTIHCYENQLPLTVDNVKKFPILHGRCGTSFLFMVMIISIFVLSFFGWPNPLQRLLIRLLMFPVIAGISYEINRLIGRSDSKIAYYLSYPGLMIQKIATVKEPDESQIEVAIRAMEAVIPDNEVDDQW